jgi:hypothetical protein
MEDHRSEIPAGRRPGKADAQPDQAAPVLRSTRTAPRSPSHEEHEQAAAALYVITRLHDALGDYTATIHDSRRFAVFLRLIAAAEHELDAATRPPPSRGQSARSAAS